MAYVGLGISIFPMVVPYSFDLWQAAASSKSQAFLAIGTMFLLPFILGYTVYSYWVFRGKVVQAAPAITEVAARAAAGGMSSANRKGKAVEELLLGNTTDMDIAEAPRTRSSPTRGTRPDVTLILPLSFAPAHPISDCRLRRPASRWTAARTSNM